MALLRTILAFMIVVILAHLGITYAGMDANQNGLTSGVVSLGELLETPARALLDQQSIGDGGLYFTGLAAAGLYLILFLLLGVGRR